MNAHRINIFNTADNYYVIGRITHYFKFVFFPTQDRFFKKNFGRWAMSQTRTRNLSQIIFIKGDSGTKSTHSEGRTNNNWVLQYQSTCNNLIHRVTNNRFSRLAPNFFDDAAEEFAVFSAFNCIHICADQLCSVALQRSGLLQTNSRIKRCLATKGC